jgi:hypothetical protein
MTDEPDFAFFQCDHIGVAGTTRVVVKQHPDGAYEARVGVAIMGGTNMKAEDLENANPFDKPPAFYDNYASGVGDTREAAIEAMKVDMRSIADSLWAE